MEKKHKLILFLLAQLFTLPIVAQVNNALDFDGTDDFVQVPAASSLIAGSNQISLTCWAYPTNASPAFPDFDGFTGMRDDATADFYIIQLSANSVEARFTNSGGTMYTITSPGLVLNTWQHYAFTYDGSWLRLYRNGNITDSLQATGVINNSAVDLLIGDVKYTGADYYLDGQVDEVSLWNKTLGDDEIKCIHSGGIDSLTPNLQLYFNFNQGISGGTNSAQTILHDASNHINGLLLNMALTGNSSNYVDGISGNTLFTDTLCQGDQYVFGSQILTSGGAYFNTLSSSLGCDSIVQLNLTVLPVDTTVNLAGASLIASVTGALYQWIDCGNGNAVIPGAFINTYSPSVNGSYAVIITKNGCSDTSSCHAVNNVGISDPYQGRCLTFYPSPAHDHLVVSASSLQKKISLTISDPLGRVVFIKHYHSFLDDKINIVNFLPGLYTLIFKSTDGIVIKKFMKD